jgi:hypothetical protein
VLTGPLVLEKRKVDLVGPLALEPLITNQVGFASHPETRGKPDGGFVPAVHSGSHPVQAKLVEGEVQQGVSRLSGVAVPGMIRIKHPAHLTAPMLGTPEEEHDIADHPLTPGELNTQCEGVTLGLNRAPRPTVAKSLRDHLGGHRTEWNKPAHFGQ